MPPAGRASSWGAIPPRRPRRLRARGGQTRPAPGCRRRFRLLRPAPSPERRWVSAEQFHEIVVRDSEPLRDHGGESQRAASPPNPGIAVGLARPYRKVKAPAPQSPASGPDSRNDHLASRVVVVDDRRERVADDGRPHLAHDRHEPSPKNDFQGQGDIIKQIAAQAYRADCRGRHGQIQRRVQ